MYTYREHICHFSNGGRFISVGSITQCCREKEVKRKTTKSALIVWGGWDGHTPQACADLFDEWLRGKGFRTVVSDSLDIYCNRRRMRLFSLPAPSPA